jgi:AraC family transcriptional regulator, positive regulator of tynA and feaB
VRHGLTTSDRGQANFVCIHSVRSDAFLTERGSTFSRFISSLRLDHAARLLHRRAFLNTSQPLSEIAYACGFNDYTHFARKFRHRFGSSPGARAGGHGGVGNGAVRSGTGESAS